MDKANGYDNIHICIPSTAAEVLSPILSYFFGHSFKFGMFSKNLKTANVISMYRARGVKIISNYRPKSILSCPSKMLLWKNSLKRYLRNI